MKTMTIRNVPPDLDRALQRERVRRGASLNQTVLELLGQGLGVGAPASNGLAMLAGRWTAQEHDRFEEAVGVFEQVDPDVWS